MPRQKEQVSLTDQIECTLVNVSWSKSWKSSLWKCTEADFPSALSPLLYTYIAIALLLNVASQQTSLQPACQKSCYEMESPLKTSNAAQLCIVSFK